MIKYHNEFHFGHDFISDCNLSSGQYNDSWMLGISKCNGISATPIKKLMPVDLKWLKTIFSTHSQNDHLFTFKRKSD